MDLLFQKFDEGTLFPHCLIFSKGSLHADSNIQIHELDIPVNAVATALKDFVSKHLPPLFEEDVMAELEDIAGKRRSERVTRNRSFPIFSFRYAPEADGYDNWQPGGEDRQELPPVGAQGNARQASGDQFSSPQVYFSTFC